MNETASTEREPFGMLPGWLRPRAGEQPGTGRTRLIETTLMLLLGLLLAFATVNDLARQTAVNHRLINDLATWRAYTGHHYHDLSIEEEVFGIASQKEVVCGNISAAPPKTRPQICLVIYGPVRAGRREVHGGWYLPVGAEDLAADRYGCFGPAAVGLCPR
jgi:hypothetical protein